MKNNNFKGANWDYNIDTPFFLSVMILTIVFYFIGYINFISFILILNIQFCWGLLLTKSISKHNNYTISKGDYKIRKFKFF